MHPADSIAETEHFDENIFGTSTGNDSAELIEPPIATAQSLPHSDSPEAESDTQNTISIDVEPVNVFSSSPDITTFALLDAISTNSGINGYVPLYVLS